MRTRSIFLILALLAVFVPAASAGAAQVPTCQGKEATIVATPAGPGLRTIIEGTSGNDVIIGTAGRDLIRSGDGHDTICAGSGRDVVYGGRGRDSIRGEGGADRLVGGTGIDTVHGGGGNDIIKGGYGVDKLTGARGADKCYDEITWHACELVNDDEATVNTQLAAQDLDVTISLTEWRNEMEREILRLMNVERKNNGNLPALTINQTLNSGSRSWSVTLSNSSDFYHDPSIAGQYAENIAQNYWAHSQGFTTRTARTHAAQMMDQWMNSAGHRANILNPNYSEMGAGVALIQVSSNYTYTYGTQRFAL